VLAPDALIGKVDSMCTTATTYLELQNCLSGLKEIQLRITEGLEAPQ
jgi:hypothetical protein